MRKTLIASAAVVALLGGQAMAASSAPQTLRVGDRIGAPMEEVDNQIQGFFSGIFAAGGGGLGGALLVIGAIVIPIVAVAAVADAVSNDDSASG